MKYSVDKQEKYTVFTIQEDKVDSTISPDLKSKFVTLHAEGISNIILDLSQVKYMDSSGLSAMLTANRLYSEGGILVIVGASEHVFKLIKISQLDKVFNLLPTTEEAVDAVFMSELENGFKSEDVD